MLPDRIAEKIAKQSADIDSEQLKVLKDQADAEKKSLQDVIIDSKLLTENDFTRLYAARIDVPVAEYNPATINRDILQLIPEASARQYHAVAFDQDENSTVLVALEDPDDVQTISFLRKQLGRPIRVFIASASKIRLTLDRYSSGSNDSSDLAKAIDVENKEVIEDEVTDEDVKEDSPIAQSVNLIIGYGVKKRASDIHIEPRDDFVLVRYRVDGILQEANKLPRKVLSALVSRIKILSNLKIDEHRAPQDGRFKMAINDHLYALRVSTLPTVEGEKIVLRILDESGKAATLRELGYWGISLKRVQDAILQPHGLVLVTGPTGSGKSTSLFSILSSLNNPKVNISTIEDPVEYRIIGVNQTQVNPLAGMTFANGLRSLLRQDPNILMVGEIRDGDTADLAVQAALTGHLVFSTLHTNDAATCLPRLIDMGIEPFLIASTATAVIGQRLVRRLCPECRIEYKPDKQVVDRIQKAFNISSQAAFLGIHKLEAEAIADGIGVNKQNESNPDMSTSATSITRLWRVNEQGCNICNHNGYNGRIGLYEVLENNAVIQKKIIGNATSEDISIEAVKGGMVTMTTDGIIKALRGETTVEEIMRIVSSGSR